MAWKPWTGAALSSVSFAHRNRGRSERTLGTARWQDYVHRTTQYLAQVRWPSDGNFTHLHTHLTSDMQNTFSHTAERLMTTGQVQGLASQKWALYKLIKTPRVVSLRTMFECWQLITQHRKVHRDQQTASAQAKEDRIQQVLTDARQAADRHDLSRLHQLVRRLNPKEKTTRIQIRDASGRILSPMEEFTSLKQYVQTTWSGAPLPPFRASTGPGIPFTEADLVRALSSLAPLKANAPGTCASLSVLCNPSLIASQLMSLLHLWWHRPDPYIPTSWKSGHLFLLPKPGKPPNSAKNLRPLALQEVFGKAVIGLVSERARASVLDILCSTPQLAYLPFRGTADAIARAVHHCQEVAHLITQFQRPAERQNSQLARTGLIGGALLSLDLSKAFDSVSRTFCFVGWKIWGLEGTVYICYMNGIEAPTMTFPTKVLLRLFRFIVGFDKDVKLLLFFGVASQPVYSLDWPNRPPGNGLSSALPSMLMTFWSTNLARPWNLSLSLFTIVAFSLTFWRNTIYRSIYRNVFPWSPCRAVRTRRHKPDSSSAPRTAGTSVFPGAMLRCPRSCCTPLFHI